MKSLRTKTGTVVREGIEYNHYPPPKALIKIMKRHHARALIRRGSIRLGNITQYQQMENTQLGDLNDGIGMFQMQGHQYTTRTNNPMYVFCMSFPQISNKRIAEIARSENYNCILKINNPKKFFKRIRRSIKHDKKPYWVHCGRVKYSRGKQVSKKALNSQLFNYNVFQKSPRFARDKEYRLSLMDLTDTKTNKKYTTLTLGDCTDIMTIEELRTRRCS